MYLTTRLLKFLKANRWLARSQPPEHHHWTYAEILLHHYLTVMRPWIINFFWASFIWHLRTAASEKILKLLCALCAKHCIIWVLIALLLILFYVVQMFPSNKTFLDSTSYHSREKISIFSFLNYNSYVISIFLIQQHCHLLRQTLYLTYHLLHSSNLCIPC